MFLLTTSTDYSAQFLTRNTLLEAVVLLAPWQAHVDKKGNNLGVTITWCIGMENPNVEQCFLPPAQAPAPEAPCMDVNSCIITTVS